MSSDDDRTKVITVEAVFGAMFAFLGVGALITILLIYSIYCLRRRQRNLTASNGVAPPPTALNLAEPPTTGLDQSTIALIPKFVYKASHHPHLLSQGEDGIECSVCLSTIVEEAIVRLLPNCKHLFHEDCIDVWLRSHMTCPVCRAMVDPRPQTEIDELGAAVQPTAPPQEESTADGLGLGGPASRLSSFRRMLSRERSSRRVQSCGDEEAGGAEDIERH